MRTFLARLGDLSWSGPDVTASLDALFGALTELFEAEVVYYYARRVAQRRWALACRICAFAAATAGIVCPLLASADPSWAYLGRYGYVLLALGAAGFAANELFGGSNGHIRSVTTQYHLERLLTHLSIDWQSWRARSLRTANRPEARRRMRPWRAVVPQMTGPPPDLADEGFAILRAFTVECYGLISNETGEWGTALREAEAAYRQKLGEKHAAAQRSDDVSSKAKAKTR
ncbi:SLATT domain-containing protein [Sphingomonas sp. CFBP 8760]|uniref:SLATT domain-containing protein n=1 Tax=Sphingomonas sp. CFBP 8760 TaxID=2775282 RepID=UPI0017830668|nr:SLATT domain-containing protein [Sphingomonas sp. CFBP 8760]MBD8548282.1 SLATT domain-containing protein [Sphingomonas sp. CFBP 8760]